MSANYKAFSVDGGLYHPSSDVSFPAGIQNPVDPDIFHPPPPDLRHVNFNARPVLLRPVDIDGIRVYAVKDLPQRPQYVEPLALFPPAPEPQLSYHPEPLAPFPPALGPQLGHPVQGVPTGDRVANQGSISVDQLRHRPEQGGSAAVEEHEIGVHQQGYDAACSVCRGLIAWQEQQNNYPDF